MINTDSIIGSCKSEETECKYNFVAPVAKKVFKNPKINFLICPSHDLKNLENKYNEMRNSYEFNPQIKAMIIRILNSSELFIDLQPYPLIKIFSDVCQELTMSEIEFSGFALYLTRFFHPPYNQSIMILLYTMAFAIKLQLSEDFLPLLHHLSLKIPGFTTFYNSWLAKSEDFMYIDMRDLNQIYKILTKKPYDDLELNHNFYVDHILEIAPSSTYEKKWWESELAIPVDIFTIESPAFIKLDSVFNDIPVPQFQKTLSLSSIGSAFSYIYDF